VGCKEMRVIYGLCALIVEPDDSKK
jgi:hypothetical protein